MARNLYYGMGEEGLMSTCATVSSIDLNISRLKAISGDLKTMIENIPSEALMALAGVLWTSIILLAFHIRRMRG